MSRDEYVVPGMLRSARFVPRQAPGRREPARVTPGAFRARGLTVPEDRRRWNTYQLSERQGWPWSPGLDAHVRRRGAELHGGDQFVCLDLDVQLAVDGSVWLDGLRYLTDAGTAAGQILDLTACLSVRTPGARDRGHGGGWHLWWRANPECPVRLGPLRRCAVVEVKSRCTSPGSPGYTTRNIPDELPMLPRWIAELAGAPVAAVTHLAGRGGGNVWKRLHGVVGRVLVAEQGERNRVLYWASARAGEMVAAGDLEPAAAETALKEAAADIGLTRDDGEHTVTATIRSGFERAGVTYAAAR